MSKNEKMMILEMLERGQISAEEAARLLQAAGGDSPPRSSEPPRPDSQRRPGTPVDGGSIRGSSGVRADSSTFSSAANNNGSRRVSSAPSSSESFSDELTRKFDTFIKDIEPKVHRFTEVVVEKTAQAADKISKSLSSPPPPPMPPRAASPDRGYASRPTASTSGAIESNIEIRVGSYDSELNIAGLNGQVLIRGYNGDKISARLITRPKRHGAPVELMSLGNKYYLNYDENDFHQVSIDAYVPESMFYVVKIASINGLVNVSTLKTTHLAVENSNGNIELNNITADSVKTDCQSGNLQLTGITAANGSFENFSGSINAAALDISKLSVSNFNGALSLNVNGFFAFDDYMWSIDTSNGKTNLYLPSAPNIGYHLKAHTSLGDIKIGLTGINYLINEKSFAEAKSFNYDSAQKQIRLILETSNAPLIVN